MQILGKKTHEMIKIFWIVIYIIYIDFIDIKK